MAASSRIEAFEAIELLKYCLDYPRIGQQNLWIPRFKDHINVDGHSLNNVFRNAFKKSVDANDATYISEFLRILEKCAHDIRVNDNIPSFSIQDIAKQIDAYPRMHIRPDDELGKQRHRQSFFYYAVGKPNRSGRGRSSIYDDTIPRMLYDAGFRMQTTDDVHSEHSVMYAKDLEAKYTSGHGGTKRRAKTMLKQFKAAVENFYKKSKRTIKKKRAISLKLHAL